MAEEKNLGLGIIFSANVQNFVDGIEKVRNELRGLIKEFVPFKETQQDTAKGFDDIEDSSKKASTSLKTAKQIILGITKDKKEVDKLETAWASLHKRFKNNPVLIARMEESFADLINKYGHGENAIEDIAKVLRQQGDAIESAIGKSIALGNTQEDLVGSYNKVAHSIGKIEEQRKKALKAADEQHTKDMLGVAHRKELGETEEKLTEQIKKRTAEIERLNAEKAKTDGLYDEETARVQGLTLTLKKLTEQREQQRLEKAKWGAATEEEIDKIEELEEKRKRQKATLELYQRKLAEATEKQKELTKAADSSGIKEQSDAQKKLAESLDKRRDALEKLNAERAKTKRLYEEEISNVKNLEASLEELQKQRRALSDAKIEEWKKTTGKHTEEYKKEAEHLDRLFEKNKRVVELANKLEKQKKELTAARVKDNEAIEKNEKAIERVNNTLHTRISLIRLQETQLDHLSGKRRLYTDEEKELIYVVQNTKKEIGRATAAYKKYGKELESVDAAVGEAKDAFDKLNAELSESTESTNVNSDAIKKNEKLIESRIKSVASYNEELKNTEAELEQVKSKTEGVTQAERHLQGEIDDTKKQLTESVTKWNDYSEAVSEITRDHAQAAEGLSTLNKKLEANKEFAQTEAEALAKQAAAIEKANAERDKALRTLEEEHGLKKESLQFTQLLTSAEKELVEVRNKKIGVLKRSNAAQAAYNTGLKKASKIGKEYTAQFRAMELAAREHTGSISDLTNMFRKLEDAQREFRGNEFAQNLQKERTELEQLIDSNDRYILGLKRREEAGEALSDAEQNRRRAMEEGSASIKEQISAINDLIAVERKDLTVIEETIQAQDHLTKKNALLPNQYNQIATSIQKADEAKRNLVQGMREEAAESAKVMERVRAEMTQRGQLIAKYKKNREELVKQAQAEYEQLKASGQSTEELKSRYSALFIEINKNIKAQNEYQAESRETLQANSAVVEKMSKLEDVLEDGSAAWGMYTGEITKTAKGLNDWVKKVTDGAVSVQKFDKAFKDGESSLTAYGVALEKNKHRGTEFRKALQGIAGDVSGLSKGYQELSRDAGISGGRFEELVAKLKKVDQAFVSSVESMNISNAERTKLLQTTNRLSLLHNVLNNKLEITKDGLRDATTGMIKYGNSMDDAEQRQRRFNEQLIESESRGESYTAALRKIKERFPELGDEFQDLARELDVTYKAFVKTQLAMGKSEEEVRKLVKSTDLYETTLKRLSGELRIYDGQLKKSADSFLNFGRMQERLREQFVRGGVYSIARSSLDFFIDSLRMAVSVVVEFDQALKNLQAIANATESQVIAMGSTIRQTAQDTKFSVTEISDGMVILAQTGLNTSETIKTIGAVANLATGTLTGLEESADLVTTTMKAFNIEASRTTHIADVMANAINQSKLTIDKLRTSFNYMAATASLAGVSLEETAASMTLLADSGLRASTIGTGFRQVLNKLIDPSEKVRAVLYAQGVALDQLNPQLVGYETSLGNLANLLGKVDANGQVFVDMGKAFEMFGLRGSQAASVLVESFLNKDYDKALEKMREAGSAARMAETQMEGLGAMLKNLSDRFGEFIIVFAESTGIAGVLKAATTALRGFFSLMSDVFGNYWVSVISQVTALTVAIKGLTVALNIIRGSYIGTAVAEWAGGFSKAVTSASSLSGALKNVVGWLGQFKTLGIMAVVSGIAIGLKEIAVGAEKAASAAALEAEQHRSNYEALTVFVDKLGDLRKAYEENANSSAYDVYKEQLESFARGNEELVRTLGALTNIARSQILPVEILADKLTKIDYDQLYGKIGETEKLNAAKDALKGYADQINSLYKIMSDDSGSSVLWKTLEGGIFEEKYLAEDLEDLREYQDGVRGLMDMISVHLRQSIKAVQSAGKEFNISQYLEEYIDQMGLIPAVAEEVKKAVMDVYESIIDESTKAIKNFRNVIQQLPSDYGNFVRDMSISTFRDFQDFQSKLNLKIVKFKEYGETIGRTEREIQQSIAVIRAKEYADYRAGLEEQTSSYKESVEKRVGVVKDFIKQTVGLYRNNYSKVLEFRKTYAGEERDIEKELAKSNLKTRKDYEDQILGYTKLINQQYLEGIKETYSQLEDAVGQVVDKLRGEFDKLKGEYDGTLAEMRSAEESYHDDIRDLRQNSMSDVEKWNDDRAEANRLLAEGMRKQDVEMLKEARSMFKSLAQEVKNESGETVASLEQTSKVAEAGVTKAHEATMSALKRQANKFAEDMASVEQKINEAKKYLQQYKDKVAEVSRTSLTLNTYKLRSEFDSISNYLEKLRARFLEPIDVNVLFRGTGSDTKLITEKIEEVDKKVKGLNQQVDVGVSVEENLKQATDTPELKPKKVSEVSVDFRATEVGRKPAAFSDKVQDIKEVIRTISDITSAASAMYRVMFVGGPSGERSVIEEGKEVLTQISYVRNDIERITPIVKTIFTGEDGEELSDYAQESVSTIKDASDTIGRMGASFKAAFVTNDGTPMVDAVSDIIVDSGYLSKYINDLTTSFTTEFTDEQGVTLIDRVGGIASEFMNLTSMISGLSPVFSPKFIADDGQHLASKVSGVASSISSLAKLIGGISSVFKIAFVGHGSTERPITDKISEIWNYITGFASRISSVVSKFVIGFVSDSDLPIMDYVSKVLSFITSGFDSIKGKVADSSGSIFGSIVSVAEAAFGKIRSGVSTAIDFISSGADRVKDVFSDKLSGFDFSFDLSFVYNFVDKIKEVLSNISIPDMSGLWNSTIEGSKTAYEYIVSVFDGLLSKSSEFFSGFGSGIASTFETVKEKTSNLFNLEAINGFIGGFTEKIKSLVSFLTDNPLVVRFLGWGSTAKPITEKISEIIGWVEDFVSNIGDKVANFTTNFVTDDGSPIGQAIEWIKEKIEKVASLISGIKSVFKIAMVAKDDDMSIFKKIALITKEFKNVGNIISTLKTAFSVYFKAKGAKEDLKDGIEETKGWFSSLSGYIKSKAVDYVINFLGKGSAVRDLTDKIGEMKDKVVGFGKDVVKNSPEMTLDFGSFRSILATMWEFIQNFFENSKNKAVELGSTVVETSKNAAESVKDNFGQISDAFAKRSDIVNNITLWDKFVGKVKSGFSVVKSFATDVSNKAKDVINTISYVQDKISSAKSIYRVIFTGDDTTESVHEEAKSVYKNLKNTSENISKLKTEFTTLFTAGAGQPLAKGATNAQIAVKNLANTINLTKTSVKTLFVGSDGKIEQPLSFMAGQVAGNMVQLGKDIGDVSSEFMVSFQDSKGWGLEGRFSDIVWQAKRAASDITSLSSVFTTDFLANDGLLLTGQLRKTANSFASLSGMINGLVSSFTIGLFGEGSSKKHITDKLEEVDGKFDDFSDKTEERSPSFVTRFIDSSGYSISTAVETVKGWIFGLSSYISKNSAEFATKFTDQDGFSVKSTIKSIQSGFKSLGGFIGDYTPEFLVKMTGNDRPLLKYVTDAYGSVKTFLGYLSDVKAVLSFSFLTDAGLTFEKKMELLQRKIGILSDFIQNAGLNLKFRFTDESGNLTVDSIIEGVKSSFTDLVNFVRDFVSEKIRGYFGKMITPKDFNFSNVFDSFGGEVEKQVAKATEIVTGFYNKLFKPDEIVSDIQEDTTFLDKVKGWAQKALVWLISVMPDWSKKIVSKMITGVTNGLSDGETDLKDTLDTWVGTADKTAKSLEMVKFAIPVAFEAEDSGLSLPEYVETTVNVVKTASERIKAAKEWANAKVPFTLFEEKSVEEEADWIVSVLGGAAVKLQSFGEKIGIELDDILGAYESFKDGYKRIKEVTAKYRDELFDMSKMARVAKTVQMHATGMASKLSLVGAAFTSLFAGWNIGKKINEIKGFAENIQMSMGIVLDGLNISDDVRDVMYNVAVEVENVIEGIGGTIKKSFREIDLRKPVESIFNFGWNFGEWVNKQDFGFLPLTIGEAIQESIAWADKLTKIPTTIADVVEKAKGYWDSFTNIFSTAGDFWTNKLKVLFVGEGSSEKPLSEKTDEMVGKVQGFKDKVSEGVKTTVHFTTEGADKLQETAKEVVDKTKIAASEVAKEVANSTKQSAEEFGKGFIGALRTAREDTKEMNKEIEKVSSQFRKMFSREATRHDDLTTTITEPLLSAYEDFYDKLDSRGKLSFKEFWEDSEKKVDAYNKQAVAMKITAEERDRTIRNMRLKYWEEFKETVIRQMDEDIDFGAALKQVDEASKQIQFHSQQRLEEYQDELNRIELERVEAETAALEKRGKAAKAMDFGELNQSLGNFADMTEKEKRIALERYDNQRAMFLASKTQAEKEALVRKDFNDSLNQSIGTFSDLTEEEIRVARDRNVRLNELYNDGTLTVHVAHLLDEYGTLSAGIEQEVSNIKLAEQKLAEGDTTNDWNTALANSKNALKDLRTAMDEVVEAEKKATDPTPFVTYTDKVRKLQLDMATERVAAIKASFEESIKIIDQKEKEEIALVEKTYSYKNQQAAESRRVAKNNYDEELKAAQEKHDKELEAFKKLRDEQVKIVKDTDVFEDKEELIAKVEADYKKRTEVIKANLEEQKAVAFETYEERVKASKETSEKESEYSENVLEQMKAHGAEMVQSTEQAYENKEQVVSAAAQQDLQYSEQILAHWKKHPEAARKAGVDVIGIEEEVQRKREQLYGNASKAFADSQKEEVNIAEKFMTEKERVDEEYHIERAKFWNMNVEMAKGRNIDLIALEKRAAEARTKLEEDTQKKVAAQKGKEAEAAKKAADDVNKVNEDKSARQIKLEEDAQRQIERINAKAGKERIKIYKDTMDKLKKEAETYRDLEKQIAEEILTIRRKNADFNKSIESEIRDIRRSEMSDLDAYKDKWKEVSELEAKMNSTEDYDKKIAIIEEITSKMGGLKGEVKDGETVAIEQDTANRRVIDGLKKMQAVRNKLDEARAKQQEAQKKEVQERAQVINKSISEIDASLTKITEKVNTIDIQMNDKEVIDAAKKIQEEINNIEGKEIKISVDFEDISKIKDKEVNIRANLISSPKRPASEGIKLLKQKFEDFFGSIEKDREVVADASKTSESLEEADQKTETLVERIKGLTKKFVSSISLDIEGMELLDTLKEKYDELKDKTVQVTMKTKNVEQHAEGGPAGMIPGYGGGDTVPALLERGEFVFRKEAVRKYGLPFMYAVNSLKLDMQQIGHQLGGYIQSPSVNVTVPQKFQTGGAVMDIKGLENYGTFEMQIPGSNKSMKAIAQADVLRMFKEGYEQEIRRRSN